MAVLAGAFEPRLKGAGVRRGMRANPSHAAMARKFFAYLHMPRVRRGDVVTHSVNYVSPVSLPTATSA